MPKPLPSWYPIAAERTKNIVVRSQVDPEMLAAYAQADKWAWCVYHGHNIEFVAKVLETLHPLADRAKHPVASMYADSLAFEFWKHAAPWVDVGAPT